jgi:Domain of unknown function (DUF4760)
MNSSHDPDKFTNQVSFTIVISAAATSFGLAALLTFGFWSCIKKDDDRNAKTWEFGRDAIGMAAGISGAVYAFQSVRQNAGQQEKNLLQSARQHEVTLKQSVNQQMESARQHEITLKQSAELQHRSHSIDITREYINLWDEEPFAHACVTVSELIRKVNGATENRAGMLHQLLEENPQAKQDVTLILNLLEKIAIFRKENLLNEVLLRKFYQSIVLRSWEVLKFYAIDRRSQINGENNGDIYENIEALYKEWSENR